MNINKVILVVFLFSAAAVFGQEISSDSIPKFSYATLPELWEQLDDIFNDPNFGNAHWGVVIQSLQTGEYFYKRNEDKLFIPASNLKLFTSAAALMKLGPDYTFSTELYTNGNVDGSILYGDLILVGRGDPTISGRFNHNDLYLVFNRWADSLLEKGIDEITGNIIGDDNLFDDKPLGNGWAWDQESKWFSAPAGAISYNDNTVEIVVRGDSVSGEPQITIIPDTKYVVVINNVTLVPPDSINQISAMRERGTNVITVSGSISSGSEYREFVTVNNPTQYAMVVFKEVLEKKGIKINGYSIDIDDINLALNYSKFNKLFTNKSEPLKEILKELNKNSNNFYAEQLLKTLGLEELSYGTSENGIEVIAEVLEEMGINPEALKIVDGSGLSRLNLVTPRQMVTLLTFMNKSKYFVPFYNSFPIAGKDATLGKRMVDTRAEDNVRAKTGFLDGVRSLSGYLRTGDDELIAFSIICNNFNVPVKLADNLQDFVCMRLANFKRTME